MDKIKNISAIKDCYGCGLCATVCAKGAISIILNKDGFYEPQVNTKRCTQCGLCLDVCSFVDDKLAHKPAIEPNSYAAWSKDDAVRRKCSSGGVAFELGRHLIEKGYKVCGVRYNPTKNRAEHYIATSIEELIQSVGSKYIQSYTVDGFKGIDRKQKYLVIGTPCQIDSFRRYIRKFKCEDNFLLVDFFCHGVPSKLMWDKYLFEVEKTTGKVVYVSWRNKFSGWHDSWSMAIDGEMHGEPVNWHDSYNLLIRGKKSYYNSKRSQGDSFYNIFLSNSCLGKACYDKCKFKYSHSSADIRIGDLWGKKYKNDGAGVSAVAVFSSKGQSAVEQINCNLQEESFEVIAEGQMKAPTLRTEIYNRVYEMLQDDTTSISKINALVVKYNNRKRMISRLKHPLRSLSNILKKYTNINDNKNYHMP